VERYRPRAPFDTVTSRAFSTLERMVALSRHLLAPGGRWVAMKGKVPEAELAELPEGLAAEVVPLAVPGETAERHAVVIRSSP